MNSLAAWTPTPRWAIPDYPRLIDYLDHYARVDPAREAVADLGGARYSYAALAERVHSLAAGLRSAGVRPGDRVATLAPPHSEAWIAFLASVAIGAVWVGLNPRYTIDELRYLVGHARPALILARSAIGDRDFLPDLQQLQAEFPSACGIYLLDGARIPFPGSDMLFRFGAHPNGPATDPAEPCLLVYTSGTTGKPKGALLRQSGLIACSRVQAHHYGMVDGRTLNPLPINHVGSICDTATTILVQGGAQIFVDDFDPARLLPAFESERITVWGGVPTMFQILMAHPAFDPARLAHVRRVLWSGAPMPRAVAERLAGLGLPMHNFYGMTETTGSICFTAPDADLDELLDTVGHAEASYDVRIADSERGTICDEGEIGEIQTRSPGVLHSYLDAPDATRAAFTEDGWFRTGDLALRDAKGRVHLRGRSKEMYKSGGYNVYPLEIEAVLESHPQVATAVVVSRPDPVFYEVGHAFVVPAPGPVITAGALMSHARKHLANYKVPKSFTVTDQLPMLPVGKVDRTALRQRAVDMP